MFSIGFSEILLIIVLVILFVKPEKLPGIAKEAGRFLGELKRIGADFKKSVSEEAAAISEAGKKDADKPADDGNKDGGGGGGAK